MTRIVAAILSLFLFAGPGLAQAQGQTDDAVERREKYRLEYRQKEIERLLADLASPDAKKRSQALYSLGTQEATEHATTVAKYLNDPSPDIRSSAVLSLPRVNYPNAAREVARFLRDPHPDVRGSAASALAEAGAVEYANDIARLLDDPGPWEVRGLAVDALRRLKADQFASRIALKLNDQKCGLIEMAALTLGEFGQTAYKNQIGAVFRRSLQQNVCNQGQFAMALSWLNGQEYAGDIARVLRSGRGSAKRDAAMALAYLGRKEYEADIARHLDGYDSGDMALALGILGARQRAGEIAQLLGPGRKGKKEHAAQALGLLGATEHADAIAKLLTGFSSSSYCGATWALGRLRSTKHAALIAPLLKDNATCYVFDPGKRDTRKTTTAEVAREALDRMGVDPKTIKPPAAPAPAAAPAAPTAAKKAPKDTKIVFDAKALSEIRAQKNIALSYNFNPPPANAGKGMTIAVLSQGITPNSKALIGARLSAESVRDGIAPLADPDDPGPGDRLIGMVAALAPESRVVSIRILDAKGMGGWSDLQHGLERAAAVGARVVLIPISTTSKSLPEGVVGALNAGLAKGALYVAPSGASGREGADFPANHAGVVGVGAVDDKGKLFYATNYGTGVTIFAPGAVVHSLQNGFISVGSGTPQAAAIATGIFAVLWSQKPSLTRQQLVDLAVNNGRKFDAKGREARILDAQAALEAITGKR